MSESLSWQSASPSAVSSAGPPRSIVLTFDPSGLSVGRHEGTVHVASPDPSRVPRNLTVVLDVLPRACLREPFAYYDGLLATMGGASWKGDPSDRILVEQGALAVPC